MNNAAIALLLITLLAGVGCTSSPSRTSRPSPHRNTPQGQPDPQLSNEDRLEAKRGPRIASINREPALRIRISKDLQQASMGQTGLLSVGPGPNANQQTTPRQFKAPLRIRHDRQGFVLTEPNGNSVRWRLASLYIAGPVAQTKLNKAPYPGAIELVSITGQNGQPTGRFDAVNHVGMEAYLPGVLSKELYPNWHPEAYRAQAIAARSYAIWEMNLPKRKASHFDLEASEASMAYIGKGSDKAQTAVAATRGQVLVYDGRVLPAFFSSCTGRLGQDAIAAWPDKVDDLAPLRGRKHGGWGSISNRYQWGAVVRDRATLSKRIAAWGRAEKHPVAGLRSLARVQVTKTNSVGRATQVRVTDSSGRAYDLFAEQLRMAINYRAPGLPAINAKNMIFSSNAEVTVTGNQARITGQGFGHGVGMCQWGAQHMASQNRNRTQILGFYYPGTRIQKAY